MKCIDCNGWKPTGCTCCNEPWCGECNEALNNTQGEEGDGMCWACREKAAGTYIGEDEETFEEINR